MVMVDADWLFIDYLTVPRLNEQAHVALFPDLHVTVTGIYLILAYLLDTHSHEIGNTSLIPGGNSCANSNEIHKVHRYEHTIQNKDI